MPLVTAILVGTTQAFSLRRAEGVRGNLQSFKIKEAPQMRKKEEKKVFFSPYSWRRGRWWGEVLLYAEMQGAKDSPVKYGSTDSFFFNPMHMHAFNFQLKLKVSDLG